MEAILNQIHRHSVNVGQVWVYGSQVLQEVRNLSYKKY